MIEKLIFLMVDRRSQAIFQGAGTVKVWIAGLCPARTRRRWQEGIDIIIKMHLWCYDCNIIGLCVWSGLCTFYLFTNKYGSMVKLREPDREVGRRKNGLITSKKIVQSVSQ